MPEDFGLLTRVSMSAEHLTPLLDGFDAAQCTAVARRLREADVWQVPNLVLWKAWATSGPGSPRVSAAQLAARQRLHRTALVDAGFTPLEALRAATVEPARFLNTAAVAGLVKPGFQADVVLLKGNPLVDIANTRQVAGVVLRGKYHQVAASAPGGDRPSIAPHHIHCDAGR